MRLLPARIYTGAVMHRPYLLGLDVGSSFVKAALVDASSRKAVATAQSPATEMPISAPQPGWAEQDPQLWWDCCVEAVHALAAIAPEKLRAVAAIGISYQMHGLVVLDAQLQPLRPSIIWCDSRAAQLGAEMEHALGTPWCLRNLLNTPGNFTAAKLAWVKRHEPEIFARVRYAMLPGDYIALQLTGAPATTSPGLSEMILWNFAEARLADEVLGCYGIAASLLPPLVPTFGEQGRLSPAAAASLGLTPGLPVTYRAGDQPNSALALGVLNPGEAAGAAGTSGVIYAVTDQAVADPQQRVNTFLHVNHTAREPRYGLLLCINGAGSSYRWLRQSLSLTGAPSYEALNTLAGQAPAGAEGLVFLPFGNGAERMLGQRNLGAAFHGLDFNRHGPAHLARAVLEGVAFAMAYGLEALRSLGLEISKLRAAAGNLFLSETFTQALAGASGATLELRQTSGAIGAALGAGYGARLIPTLRDAVSAGASATAGEPLDVHADYAAHYEHWRGVMNRIMPSGDDNG